MPDVSFFFLFFFFVSGIWFEAICEYILQKKLLSGISGTELNMTDSQTALCRDGWIRILGESWVGSKGATQASVDIVV